MAERFAGVQAEQAGQVPAELSRFIDTEALRGQQAPTPQMTENQIGMVESALDRNGEAGAIELAKMFGLDDASAATMVSDLEQATRVGERVPVAEPQPLEPPADVVPQETSRTGEAFEATAAEPGQRTAMQALQAEQARLDALNAMDQLEQMVRPQVAPEALAVTEPRRPAVVEEKIPDEMARQKALTETAKMKQAAREKEPGYAEQKAGMKSDPLFTETFTKMINDGYPEKTARAAAYKAVEAKQSKAKNVKAGENLAEDLKKSVQKAKMSPKKVAVAPTKPAEATKTAPAAIEAKQGPTELEKAAMEAEAAVAGKALPKEVAEARDALPGVQEDHTRLWRVEGQTAVKAGGAGGKKGSNWFEENLGAYTTEQTKAGDVKYIDVPNERLTQLKTDPNATEVQLPEGYVAQSKFLSPVKAAASTLSKAKNIAPVEASEALSKRAKAETTAPKGTKTKVKGKIVQVGDILEDGRVVMDIDPASGIPTLQMPPRLAKKE
jgi:hypothetical protein